MTPRWWMSDGDLRSTGQSTTTGTILATLSKRDVGGQALAVLDAILQDGDGGAGGAEGGKPERGSRLRRRPW